MLESACVAWQPSVEHAPFVPHPHPLCEPINLAAAGLPPLHIELRAPHAQLSSFQRETVARILQSFGERRSFLLGDATGTGKGRLIAGLVAETRVRHPATRVAWISSSRRLRSEADAELASCDVARDELFFESYAAFLDTKKIEHLDAWLDAPELLLVLDECHALRNGGGKIATAVRALLATLRTRAAVNVLFSSATACSTPRHLEYLAPLFGDGSPCHSTATLQAALRTHGASLMELMAIDLRAQGAYLARQLSAHGVAVEHVVARLDAAQIALYDRCCDAFAETNGSGRQRFFQRLITAMKVRRAIELTEEHVRAGRSVVISVTNTGESDAVDALPTVDDEIDDMPYNPLDHLVDHFGPDRLAELSGRRRRLVRRNGHLVAERTPPLVDEKRRFQTGERTVAVLSRAGGVGISLDDALDERPRVHLLLELPWSAEDLLQQLGRVHRTTSRNAPTYVLLTTDLPAELRFINAAVDKLRSFGALVRADQGDRHLAGVRPPRWSAAERRSFALCLATAKACTAAPVRVVASTSGSARQHLLLIQHTLHAPDDATFVEAARAFPEDVLMLVAPWSPERHRVFPSAFRQTVRTFLLCAHATPTRATLGLLTHDLLLHIVAQLADAFDATRLAHLGDALGVDGIRELYAGTIDRAFNRLLCLPARHQHAMLRLAETMATPRAPTRVRCFLQFVRERAGRGVVADIAKCETCPTGVRVHVSYTAFEAPTPPDDATFWLVRGCTLFRADGKRWYVDAPAESDVVDESGVALDRPSWDAAVVRARTNLARRLKHLPTSFELVTTRTMAAWERSSKRILRLPPTAEAPQGVVGLLMPP